MQLSSWILTWATKQTSTLRPAMLLVLQSTAANFCRSDEPVTMHVEMRLHLSAALCLRAGGVGGVGSAVLFLLLDVPLRYGSAMVTAGRASIHEDRGVQHHKFEVAQVQLFCGVQPVGESCCYPSVPWLNAPGRWCRCKPNGYDKWRS